MSENLCPFLGFVDDPGTCTLYPDGRNACQRAQPPQRVAMPQQNHYCLRAAHLNCPGFRESWPKGLPPEWRPLTEVRKRKSYRWIGLSVAIIALLGLVIALFSLAGNPFAAASEESVAAVLFTTTPQFALETPTTTTTTTTTPTVTRTATVTLTATVEASVTATLVPSATWTVTPGPALGTPFTAGDFSLLVYEVERGDSLILIADLYGTTVDVLQTINTRETPSLWPGDILVVCVNCLSSAGLPRLQARYLIAGMPVADLAVECNCSVDDLRRWNDLGEGDWVAGERWVIFGE